jgi:hypothetical protein
MNRPQRGREKRKRNGLCAAKGGAWNVSPVESDARENSIPEPRITRLDVTLRIDGDETDEILFCSTGSAKTRRRERRYSRGDNEWRADQKQRTSK